MNPYIGKTLGSYQIIEQIGQGGMATVFKAYQPSMDRYVAVKILPSHFTQDKTFVARFTQEARVLAKLEHPHILPVYDYGEQEGITYLVMRYVEAGTLHDLIAQRGSLSLREIARIVGQVGRALGYAHDQGVIHRDIKPNNVLIDPQGNAFLTDFGIAKIVAGTANYTGTGAVVGTPAYMAPEQGLGKPLDARCDIYALGIMLYEMVTGQVPFNAETPLAVMMKHVYDPLPLPRSFRPDVPEVIERVILKALAKSPDDRFQTAAQMVETLERAVEGLPTAVSLPAIPGGPTAIFATPVPPPPVSQASTAPMPAPSPTPEPLPMPDSQALTAPMPAPSAAPEVPVAPTLPRKRPFPWLYVGGGLIGLILLGAAVLIWGILPSHKDEETEQETPATHLADATAAPALFSTDLTLDNRNAACSVEAGSWDDCSGGCGGIPYDEDFLYAEPGCDDCQVSCNFLIATGGLYDVWAWWPRGEDRATDTPFTLVYGDHETTVAVNQRDQGNTWYPLATVALAADSKFSVIVKSAATGYANFDAVQLTPAAGWRTYQNQNLLHAVATRGDEVWGGGPSGLVRWDPEQQVYTQFTTADGLPDNHINALVVDEDDRLWAATNAGMAIFDGKRWLALDESAGVTPTLTTALFKDTAGQIWAGMSVYYEPSVAYYDGAEWHAAPELPESASFALPQSVVYDEDAGLFVALDNQGLAHFDGKTWRHYTEENGLPDNDITGLQLADDAETLYLTFWRGAARMDVDSGALTPLPQLEGVTLHTVYRTPDDRLWFGGDQTIIVHDSDDDSWAFFTTEAYPELVWPVYGIAEADGLMWFATEGGGLLSYAGENFETWTLPATLRDNTVPAIVQDNAGALWFAHDGAGLTRHIPEQGVWQAFDEADGAFDYPGFPGVNSAGEVWLGGGYGQLRWYDGSGWRVMEPDALGELTIYGVTFGPSGVMWVWGYEKLVRYDPRADTWTTFTAADHPLLAQLNAIYAAPDATLWAAGSEGMALYDGNSWTTATPSKDGAEVNGVSGTPDGSVWATSDGDLYRWTGSDWELHDWGEGWVSGVRGAADGTVWVWSDTLGHFNPADGTWQTFTAADGLISGNILDVWVTSEGIVWVGTDHGVSRYVP